MFTKIIMFAMFSLLVLGGLKYWDLKTTIDNLKGELSSVSEKKLILEVDLQTEKKNVMILKNTIDGLNKEIEKMELKNQNTIKELQAFIKKTEEEKYNKPTLDILNKTDWSKATCEEAQELNKMISELKYDEL